MTMPAPRGKTSAPRTIRSSAQQSVHAAGRRGAAPNKPRAYALNLALPALNGYVRQEVQSLTKRNVERKTRHLVRILNLAYFRCRPHKRPLAYGDIPGYNAFEQMMSASAFTARELRKGLGGSTGDYTKYMRLFFDFVPGNSGYSRNRRITKGYVLKPSTVAVLNDCWRSTEPGVVVDDTGRPLDSTFYPANGLDGVSSSITVPALITLDRVQLNERITAEETAAAAIGDGLMKIPVRARHAVALRWLYLVRKWVITFGGVPNCYRDVRKDGSLGSGRLFGIGELHLQRLKKTARRLCYHGTGWWDYDFVACHPRLFLNLANAVDHECPFLRDYLDHRATISEEWAEDLDLPTSKIKRLINAMIYGQPISESPHSSLCQLIGKDGVQRVKQNLYYAAIWGEIREARTIIIDRHTKGDVVINAVGRERRPLGNEKGKRTRATKLLSHILNGYERWALEIACGERDDVLVLMHDGWVSRTERNTKEIGRQIRKQSKKRFSFQLHLKVKSEYTGTTTEHTHTTLTTPISG